MLNGLGGPLVEQRFQFHDGGIRITQFKIFCQFFGTECRISFCGFFESSLSWHIKSREVERVTRGEGFANCKSEKTPYNYGLPENNKYMNKSKKHI